MKYIKLLFIGIIVALTFSCTTLGKPIEECFVPKDCIQNYNFIGILTNRASGWEYRLVKSDTVGDICVDGTLKNVFNKTIVDMTIDQVHFTGKLEYKTESMLTNNLYISLTGDKDFIVSETFRTGDASVDIPSSRNITGYIRINGQDEQWNMSMLGRRVVGNNTVTRDDAYYNFDIDGKKYEMNVIDAFKGKNINGNFNGRHFIGRTGNVITVIKYFFNGDDMSEEDILFFTVVDIVRLLRSAENKRR